MTNVQHIVHSLAVGAPEVVLVCGTLVLLLLGVARGHRSFAGLSWGAVILFFLTAVTLFDDTAKRLVAWNGLYVADAFSAYLKVLILIGAGASIIVSIPSLTRLGIARFEYPVLILLSTLGMFVMVSANNLLTLYVGLELMSLAAYVLAAFHRDDARSAESGLKYFVLGSLSSGLLLYGVTLVYGFVGSTDFTTIAAALSTGTDAPVGVLFGLVFVLAGLAFKVSAVPFHMWTPDVYQGAPTAVTTFFAAAPKVAAIGLLMRVVLDAFSGMSADWRQIIIFMSIASMYVGAFGAIGQSNIKRLLAYSSINNVGFMLIGIAAGTAAGASAVLFYVAVYLVMTLGAFMCVMAMRDREGRPVEALEDMAGLARTRPWLALSLAIFMFSLAGLPPLFGFMPKLAVFNSAVETSLWPLAVLGVLASVIAAYYYLRVVKILYFDEAADVVVPAGQDDEPLASRALLIVAAVICSPLGYLLMGPMAAATQRAATGLL